MRDAFYLAYGGTHWGYGEIRAMPLRVRHQFVEALERQLEFEKSEIEKSRRS